MFSRSVYYNTYLIVFFFFKQKTAYEMRISDWSSDVCSSDLCLSWPSHSAYPVAMTLQSPIPHGEAPHDCPLCPRLAVLRERNRAEHPGWWNAPVPHFGDPLGRIAIVGLAPGRMGANRTGRPFTGDHAGDLLFATLAKFGLANGVYEARADDGLTLRGAIILNAVKCLPPQNRPLPEEVHNCRAFLKAAVEALPHAQVFLRLGPIRSEARRSGQEWGRK